MEKATNIYDLPPKLAAETKIAQVGLQALTGDEELVCVNRCKGQHSAKLAVELAKTSLVEVTTSDGTAKKLSLADGSADTFWRELDPRLRQLIMTAYTELHAADEEDTKAFLGSRQVRVA